VKKITSAGKAVVSKDAKRFRKVRKGILVGNGYLENTDNPFKKFCLLIP
jgi:hypothetical protein